MVAQSKPDSIKPGDLIKYYGNYGIVLGDNEWFFYNKDTCTYKIGKVSFWSVVIHVDLIFCNPYEKKLYKQLHEEYAKSVKDRVLAARNDVKDYKAGTIIQYFTKVNRARYLYIGKGEFTSYLYSSPVRVVEKHVYLKVNNNDYLRNHLDTVDTTYISDILGFEASMKLCLIYKHCGNGEYAFESSRMLMNRDNLMIKNVIIEGVNTNIHPFEINASCIYDDNIKAKLILR